MGGRRAESTSCWGLTLYLSASVSKQEESEDKKCFAKNSAKAKPMSALQTAQHPCAKKMESL